MNLEEILDNGKTLNGAKLNLPTIIATAVSMPFAAIAADATHGYLPELKGPLNELLTSGASDFVLFAVYNITFPAVYALVNRKHYAENGRFNYKQCTYDLLFKIAPAGGLTAALIYHIPRNLLQTGLMSLGLRPAYSSLFSDTVITAVYIPIRNNILKIIDEPINVILKKAKDYFSERNCGSLTDTTKRLLRITKSD